MSYIREYKNRKVEEPEDYVSLIHEITSRKDLFPEQKLFIIGILMNSNKEHYIKTLKDEIISLKNKLNEQQNPPRNTEIKRKVIVVKKKS